MFDVLNNGLLTKYTTCLHQVVYTKLPQGSTNIFIIDIGHGTFKSFKGFQWNHMAHIGHERYSKFVKRHKNLHELFFDRIVKQIGISSQKNWHRFAANCSLKLWTQKPGLFHQKCFQMRVQIFTEVVENKWRFNGEMIMLIF